MNFVGVNFCNGVSHLDRSVLDTVHHPICKIQNKHKVSEGHVLLHKVVCYYTRWCAAYSVGSATELSIAGPRHDTGSNLAAQMVCADSFILNTARWTRSKKTATGALRDMVHRRHEVSCGLHGTHVNVISFTPVKNDLPSLCRFSRRALCTSLSYGISPKSDNKCSKCGQKLTDFCKQSKLVTVAPSTKLTVTQYTCVDISCIEFYPDQTKNVENGAKFHLLLK